MRGRALGWLLCISWHTFSGQGKKNETRFCCQTFAWFVVTVTVCRPEKFLHQFFIQLDFFYELRHGVPYCCRCCCACFFCWQLGKQSIIFNLAGQTWLHMRHTHVHSSSFRSREGNSTWTWLLAWLLMGRQLQQQRQCKKGENYVYLALAPICCAYAAYDAWVRDYIIAWRSENLLI